MAETGATNRKIRAFVFSLAISSCLYLLAFYVHQQRQGATSDLTYVTRDFDKLLPPLDGVNEELMEQIFEERWKRVRQTCRRKYGRAAFGDGYERNRQLSVKAWQTMKWTYSIQKSFFVDDENKVLMCIIPKVASSTLKQLFLYLSVNSTFPSLEAAGSLAHNESNWPQQISFKPLRYYRHDSKQLLHRIANYTKVIWVRNPLVRIVSAWNNKLNGDNQIYFRQYGPFILKKYRRMPEIAAKNQSRVTLAEFFSYIRDFVSPHKMADVHWSAYNTQCIPCFMEYDYIINLENWYPETLYFFKRFIKRARGSVDAQEAISQLLTARSVNGDERWRKMVQDLPAKLVKDIRKLFSFDYDLFGYDLL